jgi:nucleoside-diphosphate-sugar epimerase
MRYLITGGAGFIGSHLCDELLARGDSVHVLDDLSTGSLDNIGHVKGNPRFECTIGSAGDSRLMGELIKECDGVFHLAAAVGVALIVDSPVRTIETNVHCTEVVLDQANETRTPVMIASTSEVYGKSAALPFREDGDLVLGATNVGRWAYACSKAIDEFLAIAYWKERQLPAIVVRLFNTVGPRQTGRYGMVVPRFVNQALAGRPLTVYGEGTQRRCFSHVQDVVSALASLMQQEEAYGEVLNVGSQEEVSILELAQRVIGLAGSPSDISLIPYDEAYEEGFEDMHRRIPDIEKVGSMIGWQPARRLDDIVIDMLHSAKTAAVA